MSTELKEELKGFAGNKRKYLLMRIAGIDSTAMALEAVGANKHNYNRWCMDSEFTDVHKRVLELKKDHRDEAIRALRKDNQFFAALLEREIVDKLREEVEAGIYSLAKTHLGREVYTRLMSELDKEAPVAGTQISWIDRMIQITGRSPNELAEAVEGEVIDVITEPTGS